MAAVWKAGRDLRPVEGGGGEGRRRRRRDRISTWMTTSSFRCEFISPPYRLPTYLCLFPHSYGVHVSGDFTESGSFLGRTGNSQPGPPSSGGHCESPAAAAAATTTAAFLAIATSTAAASTNSSTAAAVLDISTPTAAAASASSTAYDGSRGTSEPAVGRYVPATNITGALDNKDFRALEFHACSTYSLVTCHIWSSGHVWSRLVTPGHICHIWSCMVHISSVITSVKSGEIWSCLVMSCHIWSCLVMSCHI